VRATRPGISRRNADVASRSTVLHQRPARPAQCAFRSAAACRGACATASARAPAEATSGRRGFPRGTGSTTISSHARRGRRGPQLVVPLTAPQTPTLDRRMVPNAKNARPTAKPGIGRPCDCSPPALGPEAGGGSCGLTCRLPLRPLCGQPINPELRRERHHVASGATRTSRTPTEIIRPDRRHHLPTLLDPRCCRGLTSIMRPKLGRVSITLAFLRTFSSLAALRLE
jgi:hypothetical protein